jgi:hypothetical protein
VGRRKPVLAAFVALFLVLLVGFGLHGATPRTTGVEGDWSARAEGGRVVADRALVTGDNTALDLRTGTRVTLGSVGGGTPYVADDRLILASPGRVDSARLDATARWTWRSPAAATAVPLAASGGSTLVLVCPASGTCQLVGLDARGRPDWQSDGAARRDTAGRKAPLPDGSLPRVDVVGVPGGGVVVTDPASGRSTLQPGRSFLAVADGPVVTELVQDGRCVVSAFTAADPLWTRVLESCPTAQPVLSADEVSVTLRWPSRVERLALATGQPSTSAAGERPARHSTVIDRASGLTATESRRTVHSNPFRWGAEVNVIELRDDATGDVRARVVSSQPLALLRLDKSSVVVRDGGQVIRYTLDDRG